MPRVYLDHNATSPLRPRARQAMLEVLDLQAGNPSSTHAAGRRMRAVIDEARERIAGALGVHEDELLFTSGGTEADNLAVLGAVRAAAQGQGQGKKGRGIVTTPIEHPAVLEPVRDLERRGHEVSWAGVDGRGQIDPAEIVDRARNMTQGAALVALQAGNNELGTLADLAAVGQGLAEIEASKRPLLFTDAVQALGRIPLNLEAWGANLVAFSGHKVGGPMGCGVLVHRRGTHQRGVRLEPLIRGGGQENELRPGTENAAAIAGMAVAIEQAVQEQDSEATRILELTRELWAGIQNAVPDARLLGPELDPPQPTPREGAAKDRLPNTLCVLLPHVDGRVGVARLDLEGLEVSAGSACASGSLEASPVLRAIGLDEREARNGLRLSLGHTTTRKDIHSAVEILSETLGRARKT